MSEKPYVYFVPCPYCKGRKDKRATCHECEGTGNARVMQEARDYRDEQGDLERYIAGPLW